MPQRPTFPKRKCPICGDVFAPTRAHQIYDVPSCRLKAWKVDHDKKERERIRAEVLAEIQAGKV